MIASKNYNVFRRASGVLFLLLGSTMCFCALMQGLLIPLAEFPKMAFSEHVLIWLHGFMTIFMGVIMLTIEIFSGIVKVEMSDIASLITISLVFCADISSFSIGILSVFWGTGRRTAVISYITQMEMSESFDIHMIYIHFTLVSEYLLIIPWAIMIVQCYRFSCAILDSENGTKDTKIDDKEIKNE